MTRPIEYKYCKGKVKRTLKRGSKELEIVEREAYVDFELNSAGSVSRNMPSRISPALSGKESGVGGNGG